MRTMTITGELTVVLLLALSLALPGCKSGGGAKGGADDAGGGGSPSAGLPLSPDPEAMTPAQKLDFIVGTPTATPTPTPSIAPLPPGEIPPLMPTAAPEASPTPTLSPTPGAPGEPTAVPLEDT